MNNLLRASFSKLKRNKLFLLVIVASAIWAIFITVLQIYYSQIYTDVSYRMNSIFFGYCYSVGIISSIFSSLHIGTEYSSGAIRNKLIVGHNRSAIYLSNLITVFVTSLLSCIIYLVIASVIGFPFLGSLSVSVKDTVIILICSIFMILVFSSIFTMLSMVNHNKAVNAIVSVLLAVLLMYLASVIRQILEAEPTIPTGYEITASGELIMGSTIPNPHYLTGIKRDLFELVYDFLPSGQCEQFMKAQYSVFMPLYSVAITVFFSIIGIGVFKKKNIK